MGSTLAARAAGIQLATSAIASSNSAPAPTVSGSSGGTPYSIDEIDAREQHRHGDARGHSGQRQQRALAQHHRPHLPPLRAHRQPDADLVLPLRHRVRHDPVNPHRGQQQRQHAEARGQRHEDPLLLRRRLDLLLLGAQLVIRAADWDRSVAARAAATAQWTSDRRRCGWHSQCRQPGVAARRAPCIAEAAPCASRSSAYRRTRRRSRSTPWACFVIVQVHREALADGILVAEALPRQGLIDHRDLGRRRRVARIEAAAGQNRNFQRLEEVRADDVVVLRLARIVLYAFAFDNEVRCGRCPRKRKGQNPLKPI